jgi:chromosome segregation ATPase
MSDKTPTPDINLVSYRLKEIENTLDKHIEKLSGKIDLLLAELNKTTIVQSETRVKVQKLESEVANMLKTDESLKKDITELKVSVAEKLSWGASGGLVAAIIIKLLETGVG